MKPMLDNETESGIPGASFAASVVHTLTGVCGVGLRCGPMGVWGPGAPAPPQRGRSSWLGPRERLEDVLRGVRCVEDRGLRARALQRPTLTRHHSL